MPGLAVEPKWPAAGSPQAALPSRTLKLLRQSTGGHWKAKRSHVSIEPRRIDVPGPCEDAFTRITNAGERAGIGDEHLWIAPDRSTIEHEQGPIGRQFGGHRTVQSASEGKHVCRRGGIERSDPMFHEVGEEELAAPFGGPCGIARDKRAAGD